MMTTETSHVRAAAVICVARVVYQYNNLGSIASMTNEVLPAVLTLFHDGSREVVKSAIMFIRVALACLDDEALELALPAVSPHVR